MSAAEQIIEADLTYVGDRFMSGVQVIVGGDGCIAEVGVLRRPPTQRLRGRALLPGLVSAHSHAFQRALRGLGETYAAGAGDFWTWRNTLYALVERLTPAELTCVCRQTFDEMLAAGITTVGEFHYLHHADADARDFALDEVVLKAAADAGIRLVLLVAYYRTGGAGPGAAGLSRAQRRFETPSVEEFFAHVDRLTERLDRRTQSLGIAAHSLRAVPPEDVVALYRGAVARGLPFHMHVEEQRREVEEVRAALGVTPLEWVLTNVPLAAEAPFTAVHATHSEPGLVRRLLDAGGQVCVCPSTEANLGDGLPDAAGWQGATGRVCIGTDSNVRIDPLEELRWLEYGQRLRLGRRGVLRDAAGSVARRLLACGTRNGAAALGARGGTIESGRPADMIAIDLDHVSLAGWTPETLPEWLVFSSGAAAVREVCVGGVWLGAQRAATS
jgi:formimidoylglutamate deiminase